MRLQGLTGRLVPRSLPAQADLTAPVGLLRYAAAATASNCRDPFFARLSSTSCCAAMIAPRSESLRCAYAKDSARRVTSADSWAAHLTLISAALSLLDGHARAWRGGSQAVRRMPQQPPGPPGSSASTEREQARLRPSPHARLPRHGPPHIEDSPRSRNWSSVLRP
jgi:hypothetical protein